MSYSARLTRSTLPCCATIPHTASFANAQEPSSPQTPRLLTFATAVRAACHGFDAQAEPHSVGVDFQGAARSADLHTKLTHIYVARVLDHKRYVGFPSHRGDIGIRKWWPWNGEVSIVGFGRARSGLCGRRASRSGKWLGSWARTRARWVVGEPGPARSGGRRPVERERAR